MHGLEISSEMNLKMHGLEISSEMNLKNAFCTTNIVAKTRTEECSRGQKSNTLQTFSLNAKVIYFHPIQE